MLSRYYHTPGGYNKIGAVCSFRNRISVSSQYKGRCQENSIGFVL